jgi:alpha-glucoside transport system permease protein
MAGDAAGDAVRTRVDGGFDPVRIEVAVRPMSGRAVPGEPPRRRERHVARFVALALCAVLVVPIALTAWTSLRTSTGVGLGNYGSVLTDASVWTAIGHSALWAVAALCLVVLGLGIALLSQRVRRVWRPLMSVLVIPLGVSSLAAGAIFRLIFDQAPERGTVNALLTGVGGSAPAWLGSRLVWVVLLSTFAWSWLGFVVSLFRAGLDAIPADVLRVAKVEGVSPYRRLRGIMLPMLRPVFAVVLLSTLVAAVRVFDLVLVAVPDPARAGTDVLATSWLRMTSTPGDSGRAAALAVVLFVLLAGVALLCVRGLRHRWGPPDGARPADDVLVTRPWRRWGLRVLGVVIIAVWVYPVVLMVATALHSPRDAGLLAWWHPGQDGLSAASFAEVVDDGILSGVLDTLVVATTATIFVLVVAAPAAYVLARGGLPHWLTRTATTLFVVLAVAPVQVYAGPLGALFSQSGQAGAQLPLALVHAAVGAPFAVLLLRWAFVSPPASGTGGGQPADRADSVLTWAWRHARPTFVAVAVLEFVLVWNDFAVGFLISGPEASPLTLVLRGEARQLATSAGPVAAGALIASVVPVVVLLATWRTVVAGLTGGPSR